MTNGVMLCMEDICKLLDQRNIALEALEAIQSTTTNQSQGAKVPNEQIDVLINKALTSMGPRQLSPRIQKLLRMPLRNKILKDGLEKLKKMDWVGIEARTTVHFTVLQEHLVKAVDNVIKEVDAMEAEAEKNNTIAIEQAIARSHSHI